jgi:hypothetical protein
MRIERMRFIEVSSLEDALGFLKDHAHKAA